MAWRLALLTSLLLTTSASVSAQVRAVPDKVVVLTFDDSVKSHFTVVRPILKKYGFGATFFITAGFDFPTNKIDYMTWEEIARLHDDGFEIGNHTRNHRALKPDNARGQITWINERLAAYGVPKPVSFAYPGNRWLVDTLPILKELGFKFARRGGEPEIPYEQGGGFGYEPGLDHPLLIPSAGDGRPDWSLDDFKAAVSKAQFGRIAVLQFHGVPDRAHPWVNSPVKRFREYMQYLAENDFTVIALRDLEKFVDPTIEPRDAMDVVRDRQRRVEAGANGENYRTPANDADLRQWLQNMVWYHRFTHSEIRSATGLSSEAVALALERYEIRPDNGPTVSRQRLHVLPYPGGRHPRTGFLNGAIRPQRETKLSVFLPWDKSAYVVLDIPEAIRQENDRERGLLYLAHTHVPTMWDRQGVALKPLEWTATADGWHVERRLPNGVTFSTNVEAGADSLRMQMELHNGSEASLKDLRVQNCVMFRGAPEFASAGPNDIVNRKPFAAIRSNAGNRWVITAWEPCLRVWNNPPCPCLHSDPTFGTCEPGESKSLRGWLSFYEGADIEAELDRIAKVAWDNE